MLSCITEVSLYIECMFKILERHLEYQADANEPHANGISNGAVYYFIWSLFASGGKDRKEAVREGTLVISPKFQSGINSGR